MTWRCRVRPRHATEAAAKVLRAGAELVRLICVAAHRRPVLHRQRSTTGILFILYTADLLQLVIHHDYADDLCEKVSVCVDPIDCS